MPKAKEPVIFPRMEVGTAWVTLDKYGSNVLIKGLTPAELVLLVRDRKSVLGKFPVSDLEIKGEILRDFAIEKQRLRNRMGRCRDKNKTDTFKVDDAYPGEQSKLPLTFEETGYLEEARAKKVTGDVVVPMPDDASLPPLINTDDYGTPTEEPILAHPNE